MQESSLPDRITPLQPSQPSTTAAAETIKPKTIKELAAEHTELAINTLVDVLKRGTGEREGKEKPASDIARLTAATALLDRGHGKPTQYVEQTTKVITYQDLLTEIGNKEKKFIEIVDAEADEPKQLGWGDVL